jgi:hypothetical protein
MRRFTEVRCQFILHGSGKDNIVTNLMNALAGNSYINTVQYATIEKTVFSVSAVTSHNSRCRLRGKLAGQLAPMDWLDSDHMACVSCDAYLFLGYIREQNS